MFESFYSIVNFDINLHNLEWSLNQLSFVHIWINSEFSRITLNYPKLNNRDATVLSSNSRRLQISTKQGKKEFAKCPQPKTKKAIFSFSIQSNSKVCQYQLQTCSLVQTQVFFHQKHDWSLQNVYPKHDEFIGSNPYYF